MLDRKVHEGGDARRQVAVALQESGPPGRLRAGDRSRILEPPMHPHWHAREGRTFRLRSIVADRNDEIEFVSGLRVMGSANTCRVAIIEKIDVMMSEGRMIGTLILRATCTSDAPSSPRGTTACLSRAVATPWRRV